MAEAKQVRHTSDSDQVVERAKDFWEKNGRSILMVLGAVIVIVGGWLAYKYLIKEPKEEKAQEAIWKAQDYFADDSLKQALSGDRQFAGMEKIASQYSGTKAGNLAKYYAGAIALRSGDNNKAVQYLKDFSTDAKQVQARAYKLLGDAYANLGKNSDALDNYKKAAHEFEKDELDAGEYLYFAGFFAARVMNDKKEAIELFKELKSKYPSQFGTEADRFLAQMGEYKTED